MARFGAQNTKARELFSGEPATTYFTIIEADSRIIGSIQLRHYLNVELEDAGGHIGYSIRLSERGKGYGSQQLSLVLDREGELGLKNVMIACDRQNTASGRVIVKNGGVLEREGFNERHNLIIQKYNINLK